MLVDELEVVVHLIPQKKQLSLFNFITHLLDAGKTVLPEVFMKIQNICSHGVIHGIEWPWQIFKLALKNYFVIYCP